ncbi:hypothetical protein [Hypericibacter terrae]|uniref:hypothetical protein n=1 Tax=Hypericibacter terrae TaxID=2602015 RepID=UPI001244E031|nr:hypothetical protein [Hypericibacter terrae]
MQFLAVIFLGICAGLAVARAFDAHKWREMRRFWICAAIAVPLIAATAAMTWSFFANPILPGRMNAGFGPDWLCTGMNDRDLFCIKKKPPSVTPDAGSH